MTTPTYLPFYVLVGSFTTIATILVGLRNALTDTAWPKYDRAAAFRVSSVVLIAWFLLALALGLAGTYRAAPDAIPTIQYGIFIPILIWRLVDLAVACCGPDHRCCAAALDRWRAALSSAGGDLSNPLCN